MSYTTTRVTSREVYDQVKAEGLLSTRRFEVYDILFHHGPLTCGEVAERLKAKHEGNLREHSVSPRFAEFPDDRCMRQRHDLGPGSL